MGGVVVDAAEGAVLGVGFVHLQVADEDAVAEVGVPGEVVAGDDDSGVVGVFDEVLGVEGADVERGGGDEGFEVGGGYFASEVVEEGEGGAVADEDVEGVFEFVVGAFEGCDGGAAVGEADGDLGQEGFAGSL